MSRSKDELFELSHSQKFTDREEAAVGLRSIPGDDVTSALVRLSKDQDQDVRDTAIVALHSRGGLIAQNVMIDRLKFETDWYMREMIAHALSKFPAGRVTSILIKLARNEQEDTNTRVAAIESLGKRKTSAAQNCLISLAQKEGSKIIREAAGKALAN